MVHFFTLTRFTTLKHLIFQNIIKNGLKMLSASYAKQYVLVKRFKSSVSKIVDDKENSSKLQGK